MIGRTLIVLSIVCGVARVVAAETIRVPQDRPTIQAGIDAARDGDVVLVGPGTYNEEIVLAGKAITLASMFYDTGDRKYIEQTVLNGKERAVLTVKAGVGAKTVVTGFTFRNGEDGINCKAVIQVIENRFLRNGDGIDYEGSGGGVCRSNVFEKNSDDGIDLDDASAVVIENNRIRHNGDDGIEIRLHKYSGPHLNIVIRGNEISNNGEDGVQLIDYPDRSDRVIRIERNLFVKNKMAAIGCTAEGNTREDYRGSDMTERVYLLHNTFVRNRFGVTGADNFIALNNVFLETKKIAMAHLDGKSIVSHNLFWKNGINFIQCTVDKKNVSVADPLLDAGFRPTSKSPCIDSAAAAFDWKGEGVFEATSFAGSAPDLGAFEYTPKAQTGTRRGRQRTR